MISIELLERIWHEVETQENVGSPASAQELTQIRLPNGSPLCVEDPDGLRHLLIPVTKIESIVEDRQSVGVHILANIWGDANLERPFVDVVCLKPDLNDLFNLIVYDILDGLSNSLIEPDKISRQALNKWREFLTRKSSDLPSEQVLLGLFGELWFLRKLVKFTPQAVMAWNGPEGARHDFAAGSIAVEIKTTRQHQGKLILTINGHDQLEAPQGAELYFSVIRVEKVLNTGETFQKLLKELNDSGADMIRVQRLLSQHGLFPDMIRKVETSYKILETRTYEVNDEFPKITSQSFKDGTIPRGVIDIQYDIDLSALVPPPLTTDQEETFINNFVKEIL